MDNRQTTLNESSKRIGILGLGRQGQAALFDLYRSENVPHITVFDCSSAISSLEAQYSPDRVAFAHLDARDLNQLAAAMGSVDLVVDGLPGDFTLTVAETGARVGCHVVNSMYLRNPEEADPSKIESERRRIDALEQTASENRVTILPEFGLDPGIDLVLAGSAVRELDSVTELRSYGAGLPLGTARENPLQYTFTWTPIGVMRSYNRPAVVIRSGRVVHIPANRMFSEENIHRIDVSEMDETLECYPNGDAVRYADELGITDSVVELGRYACRYPGHCAFWNAASNSGFLSNEVIRVGDVEVAPQAFTAALLSGQDQFKLKESGRDLAILRVDVVGMKDGIRRKIVYQMLDFRDMETGFTAMQRTVGFTMGLGAKMILDGRIREHGIVQPASLSFDDLSTGLGHHGIAFSRTDVLMD